MARSMNRWPTQWSAVKVIVQIPYKILNNSLWAKFTCFPYKHTHTRYKQIDKSKKQTVLNTHTQNAPINKYTV